MSDFAPLSNSTAPSMGSMPGGPNSSARPTTRAPAPVARPPNSAPSTTRAPMPPPTRTPVRRNTPPGGPAVVTTRPPMLNQAQTMGSTVLNQSYDSTITSINTGFALAAALAWNEFVREGLLKNLPIKIAKQRYLVYALATTFLATFVFVLTKRFVKPDMKKVKISPVTM